MSQGLMNNVLASLGRGRATGGTKTTLVDARKEFEADLFNGTIIKMNIGGIDYFRTITDTANSTLTFGALPGAKGSGIWTVSDGVTITVTTVADTATDYTLEAKLATGNSKPLAVALDGTVIRVTLATGADGSSDNAKNTVTLVTAAIAALPEFTAVAAGEGSTVCTPTSAPVSFSGGVDEVKPANGVHYEIRRRDAAQIFGSDGTDLIPVKVGADGSLYVGGITVESVTATNVGISQTEGENVVEDQALAALIGEVQASPTANTLLARLKSLEDKIDAITDGTSPAVTQLSGSNATDKDGTTLSPSMLKDTDGYGVLRTAPATQVAYDTLKDEYKVQKGSSPVTVITLHDAVEIRDTSAVDSIEFDLSLYSDFAFLVQSTIDQNVQLSLQDVTFNSGSAVLDVTTNTCTKTIAAESWRVHNITSKQWPQANLLTKVKCRIICSTPPTAGSITVKLIGRL
jgi:hypothetical protein